MSEASCQGINLRALAKEREARHAAAASAQAGASAPHAQGNRSSSSARAPPTISKAALLSAHRSIRLARSLGLVLVVLAALGALLFGGRVAALLVAAAGIQLARAGGSWLHGALPAMLQDGSAPSAADVASASRCGLFSQEILAAPGPCLDAELEVAVENLAFSCTYGKRNCLTNEMYSGELSLAKVLRLVWGKLSQGVVRCY